MKFNEEKVKRDWRNMREKDFDEISTILSNMDYDMQTMIGSFVASICHVDYADLHSMNNKQEVTHARWLYWYALRWWSDESYERISERTMMDGRRFTSANIGIGITKMVKMTSVQGMWRDRFAVVKKFIRLKEDPMSYKVSDFCNPLPERYKLTLKMPKALKDKVEIDVREE